MEQPAGHLRVLSALHYVFGAGNLIASCLPSYFVLFGLQMIPLAQEGALPRDAPAIFEVMSRVFPYAFIAFAIASMICGVIVGVAMLLAGHCLARRAHFALLHIALLPEAFLVPAGTALALFTVLTIREPQVRLEFAGSRATPS
jgi:hypothetical protein